MSEQQIQPQQPETKKKKVSTQAILIAGIVVILIAVGAVGYLLLKQKEAEAPPVASPGSGNVVVDDGFDPDAFKRKAAENMFEVKMNPLWSFPDGASPSTDSYVANSAANSLPFYFEVTLPAQEKGQEAELLYKSPVLPLGSAVRDIVLEKDLEPGLYEADCTYHNLNPDNTIESSITVVVRLNVAG